MFFQEIHTIYIEGAMELAIATILALKEDQKKPFGETVSYFLAYATMIGAWIVFGSSYFAILWCEKRIIIND